MKADSNCLWTAYKENTSSLLFEIILLLGEKKKKEKSSKSSLTHESMTILGSAINNDIGLVC